MQIKTYTDRPTMSRAAARQAADVLRSTLAARGRARIVAATGASQFDFLEALTGADGIDWSRVEMFHLDEYVGLPIDHPASFRKYLRERLIDKTGIRDYHLLDAERDPLDVAARVGSELAKAPIDVAFVGIGENGHLAFNDPPADFETDTPYLIVDTGRRVPAAAGGRGLVSVDRGRAGAGGVDVDSADPEVERHHLHRAGLPQGGGRESEPGGRNHSERAGVDSPAAPGRHRLSRS